MGTALRLRSCGDLSFAVRGLAGGHFSCARAIDIVSCVRHFALLGIVHEARRLVALPGNDFAWSSWSSRADARAELDRLIAGLERGEVSERALRAIFAPTGPLQELSASSGWGEAMIALARRFEQAIADRPRASGSRVVSLLPSATEMVAWLGALDRLAGVSHECDYPEGVAARPVLTRSRIDPHGSSRAIDGAVRGVLENALGIYSVDEPMLAAIAPEVIVTQDLCEVCAVSIDDVRSAVARLSHRDRERVKVVSLRPTRLAHVFDDLERVARALELEVEGRLARAYLEDRLRAVAARASICAEKTRPRVVSIEWIDPVMLGGLWMPELIALAGGVAVGVESGAPAPMVTLAELSALDPEVVLVKPCGFKLDRALKERELIESTIASAVPRARIYVADGNAYFNRPGPRLVESLEVLAACVHPELEDLAAKHAESTFRLQ